MERLVDQNNILAHAATLIDNSATELREAFEDSEGAFLTVDKDIESEILDMENTANSLRTFSRRLNSV